MSYAYIAAGAVMVPDELDLGVQVLMISHTIDGSMLHVPNEEICRNDGSAPYQTKNHAWGHPGCLGVASPLTEQ